MLLEGRYLGSWPLSRFGGVARRSFRRGTDVESQLKWSSGVVVMAQRRAGSLLWEFVNGEEVSAMSELVVTVAWRYPRNWSCDPRYRRTTR